MPSNNVIHIIYIFDVHHFHQKISYNVMWWTSPRFTHVCVSYPLWTRRKTRKQKENTLSVVWDNFLLRFFFTFYLSCLVRELWRSLQSIQRRTSRGKCFTWIKQHYQQRESTEHQEIHSMKFMMTNSQGKYSLSPYWRSVVSVHALIYWIYVTFIPFDSGKWADILSSQVWLPEQLDVVKTI